MAELGIIVPTRYRPLMLAQLVENIRKTTETNHRVYFVAEESDTETLDELERLAADDVYAVVIEGPGSCAISTNAGYRASTEPCVFISNDDVCFHEDWDTAALAALGPETPIVGTNDGNGRLDCFFMVRRDYIAEHSGVFDQPNAIYHPGYQHNYCDTELAEYAKHRGVWGEAPESVTEHLHWLFGKSDRDHPNYRKARDTEYADRKLYEARKEQWAG